ncbi:MAG TPA: TolC family protein, partial [Polyangiaceae bacterium]|nr:TolC family protein [Polyangiaceae bacterium]
GRLSSWLLNFSPDAAAARARTEQAHADVGKSRVLPNPVLDGSLSNVPLGTTNPPGLGPSRTFIYGVGLSETFEPGKRSPRIDAAELRELAALRDQQATLLGSLSDARHVLGNAIYARLRTTILRESLDDAERAAEIERVRLEQQALSGVDFDRLRVDLNALRVEFGRTTDDALAAAAECAAVLGAPCDTRGATEAELDATSPQGVPPADEASLANAPALQSLELEGRASSHDALGARRRAIPDLTVRVGYTRDNFTISGDNANAVSLSIALNLPFFDHGQHDEAKALARRHEVTQARRAQLLRARAQLQSLLTHRRSLQNALTSIERDSLPLSAGVLEAAQRAFDRGGVSMTDLLVTRRTHIALRLTKLDRHFELFETNNQIRELISADRHELDTKP